MPNEIQGVSLRMIAKEKESFFAGLDIGTSKIVTVIARTDDKDNIEIIGLGESESIERGQKTNEITIKASEESVGSVVVEVDYKMTELERKVYAVNQMLRNNKKESITHARTHHAARPTFSASASAALSA